MTTVMDWETWTAHDAVGLAGLVKKGEITPRELAAQVAAGVARVNPALSAVVELFDDVIADPAACGTNLAGPFAGVPYLMKDLGPTLAGRRQEMGARLMRGHVAAADSYLTSRIRAAGLSIMGRTATPEFGVCGSAENPEVYISRNPWNPAYTSGGSSSGTGAAVAAGVLPISHASDGGGSIRIPASHNGNIGLKPSRGVFSAAPGGSDLMAVVSVQGCHSRSVRDTAAFVDACRGAAPGEFMPFWTPTETCTDLIARDPRRLRIALSHQWGDYHATPHIVAELEKAGRLLESLGHEVAWATPAIDFRAAFAAQTDCYITNIAQNIDRLSRARGHRTPPSHLIEPMNMAIWREGIGKPYSVRAAMEAGMNACSRGFGAFFQTWDIILTPCTTATTHKLGTLDFITLNDSGDVYGWFDTLWRLYAYTPLGNLAGIPGISMPLAAHDNGLPLGIQALGAQGQDGLLLQLAAQIERAIGGKWNNGRRPSIHVSAP